MARALVAFDPADFEESLELETARLEFIREHGTKALVDAWVCAERADGTKWYTYVSRDLSGHSQAEKPSAQIAATFKAEGKRPTETALRAIVDGFDAGTLNPGRQLTPAELRQLHNALDATHPDQRPAVLRALASEGPEATPVIAMLDRMREFFSADGYLSGEVLATIMIRETLDPEREAGTAVRQRLKTIAEAVVDAGAEEAIQLVADELREGFREALRSADRSQDLEAFMRALYRSVPYGYAAATLYRVLGRRASDADRRGRTTRIHRQIEEDNTRVRHAFVHQVTDLGGLQWHIERSSIHATRSSQGEAAAMAEAQLFVQARLYPAALLPALTAARGGQSDDDTKKPRVR